MDYEYDNVDYWCKVYINKRCTREKLLTDIAMILNSHADRALYCIDSECFSVDINVNNEASNWSFIFAMAPTAYRFLSIFHPRKGVPKIDYFDKIGELLNALIKRGYSVAPLTDGASLPLSE